MSLSVVEAAILGAVQGLTEFLPVSSSGHLVLAQHFLGITEPSITFDVFLHFATLLAVFIFFWKDIFKLRLHDYLKIGVSSIPAVVVGLLFKDQLEQLFSSPLLVAGALLFTAALMFVADGLLQRAALDPVTVSKDETKGDVKEIGLDMVSFKQACIIGIFQAVAITPGISRSGSTVAAGIFSKVRREAAFRFSFLMSIPVILGASLLQGLESLQAGLTDVYPAQFLVGGVMAFSFGLASLGLFKFVIKNARLRIFGWYAGTVGIVAIISLLFFT